MNLQEIEGLNNAEKILLLERLWESLDKKSVSLTDAQRKELDRRLAKHAKGESQYSTWHEVKQRLKKS